jgi:DNA-binding IclR family transcriptional regulator
MPKQPAVPSQRRRPKWAVGETTKPESGDGPYHSRTISRALDVLEAFSEEQPALTLKDLSRAIGFPDSSLFRVLVTLQNRGYLHQNDDGSYQLAPKVLLGKLSERAERFREMARNEMQSLASHFNETASLAYLFDDRIQVIESIDSLHDIRISNRPGRVLPPHCSAMGKAITAFQDREHVDRILEAYGLAPRTTHSVTDRRELIAQLGHIRETGLAYDREESTLGGICMAAAIKMPDGRVIAAVSVSTPSARMSPKREKETAAGVLQTAAAIAKCAASAVGKAKTS